MKYGLEITQTSDGEKSTVAVDAEGGLNGDVLVLRYTFDGAEYCLEIGDCEMAQTRRGEIGMSMRFIAGKTTAARFGDGGNGGEFPVHTNKLEVKFNGADCKAECEFTYGDGGEAVNLSVTATVLQ